MLTSAEPGTPPPLTSPDPVRPRRVRRLLALLATVAVLAPIAWLWWDSTMPSTYSVMDMGTPDLGGGPGDPHMGHSMPGMTRSVDELRDTSTAPAAVAVTLVARKQVFRLPTGEQVDGFTLNGESPGPELRVVQGQTVQVRLVNESVPDGVTLHWHGMDVPNADDGVAGVTQDAVRPGGEFTYRFVAKDAGTYWYHSHQVANPQVQGGLFGGLVVAPRGAPAEPETTALVHHYGSNRTVDGRTGDTAVAAAPGSRMRVRVVNTDNGPMSTWVTGAAFRLVAIDGTDVHGPATVSGQAVTVTAGGRADLDVDVPADGSGARVEMGGDAALIVGATGAPPPHSAKPAVTLDPLSYGTPSPLGFDPARATRNFDYTVGRWPGFVDGQPGVWWTVNGKMWPDVPMFVVSEGDVVRVRIANTSGEVHPMHLHGHHAVVLARDGVAATGSPWWVDTLDVADGATYDVAFVADNPGIWMDHCHNLKHAAEGLVAHLMYTGVSTPYRVGGDAGNDPE
ncbi:multicopper oxidase family protein [Pseudonocardia endophytica]|uniref:multicopper oxidase family protein n=1 Tax=Pseudonocardia endophytica TaxID=401976 RepID=UPI001FB24DC0|nr:multicopper oxidase family protein [Pseudonocardia endophytica]